MSKLHLTLISFMLALLKKEDEIKEKEHKKKPLLNFSTDIDKVQGWCFNEGIKGNCNESCENFKKEGCELQC